MLEGPLTVSAPGRICLFGEHQDYLGLPVIAMAINLRIWVTGQFNDSGVYDIQLPDIGERETIAAEFPVAYVHERDYLRSTVNVLRREGVLLPGGLRAQINGNIPLNSGTASSSALCVAWVRFLLAYSAGLKEVDRYQLAAWAHRAEVVEFGEPGGMMDHVLAAVGGVAYVEFEPELAIRKLPVELGDFVLGNGGEPKKTKTILARVRGDVESALSKIRKADEAFDLRTTEVAEASRFRKLLSSQEREVLDGTLQNRDITERALQVLLQRPWDRRKLGSLLLQHQRVNRELLRISTPRLDGLVQKSIEAGALGGKLNGSGGGGAMFAYAPDSPELIAGVLGKLGARAVVIHADGGARIERNPPNQTDPVVDG